MAPQTSACPGEETQAGETEDCSGAWIREMLLPQLPEFHKIMPALKIYCSLSNIESFL